MDWDRARVIHTEDSKHQRWTREAIEIWRLDPGTMNEDEGAYLLSHTWSGILKRRTDCVSDL